MHALVPATRQWRIAVFVLLTWPAATQTVVDPRRLGQQTSGFSDEDIADIICLLLPYSEHARQEVRRIASENSQHMVGREDVDDLRLDYTREDESRNFPGIHSDVGENHIALRFSSQVKDPSQGFTFGRNAAFCDICLQNDPHRRLSKVHFRIYLNEHGVLMLEDMSTNGTVVDEVLLKKKDNSRAETMRTLESGSKIKILMHQASLDIVFLVRIPIRDGPCAEEYKRNLDAYLADQALFSVDPGATIVPEPGGHVRLRPPLGRSPRPSAALGRNTTNAATAPRGQAADGRSRQSKSARDALPRPWNGSNKYNRVCEIGRGAFATVHKVTMKFDGRPYAAKELDKHKFMKKGVLDQKVENEMRIMQRVKHANIVEYIEHIDWDDRLLIIIMEFVGGGDLGKLIADNGPLSETGTKTMARQLLDALGYLHDMNITHRDVKPDNILVSSQVPFVVKLTDFGLSKMVDNEQTFLRTFCGTLLYCAPEVYSEYAEYDDHGRRHPRNRYRRPNAGQRYDHAVDIWSLGGVLFYALTKKPPFPARNGASHSELLHQIMTKPLDVSPLVEANVSDEGIDFISHMLDRRPETRATVEALQNYPWISGSFTTVAQSFEQIADEELHVNASQLSLEDTRRKQVECRELRVPSDDEISDDEDVDFDKSGLLSYESEKENYTFGPNHHPHRLFGEVNPSAVRSSGAIPADRLNLPIPTASFGSNATTEILGNELEIKDSFESEDSLTPRQKSQRSQPSSGGLRASVLSAGQSRSVDELNNMTFDVASQSLGGAESILENLNMKSHGVSLLRSHTTGDLNTSKRKPSSDGSEEDEVPGTEDRRGLKRIRSEASTKLGIDRVIEDGEYELLAQMPSIMRAQSGRQIDNPVHKSTYWSAQDRKTWHLAYPEMTQLQLDAFKMAASARDEEFGPGKTPLWDLALKYFPATNCERRRVDAGKPTQNGGAENGLIPSTAAPDASIPATSPDSDQGGITELKMPMHSDPGRPVVACLQSAPGSAIPFVTILITESMVSWGRATENTRLYAAKSDLRVPKYAFRILLWKPPHYDPAKNFRPWNRVPEADEHLFHFYISTKATAGIYINDVHLPSDDARNPAGPSRYWMTLHDGDRVSVWQTPDGRVRSELVFRCGWGGSAKPRAKSSATGSVVPSSQQPQPQPPSPGRGEGDFAPEDVAARLDEVCARAERKMRGLSEHDLKMEEANHDAEERMRHRVDRERQRSREFEARRLGACRALGIRRVSPAPGVTLGEESATQTPWASYGTGAGGRTVPNFRHASPSTLELLRGARRG
ncbi:Pkinase-domain-containing protein [Parathielavia hyrcaniae]|uniref:Autophagy-related protein 1 n=1 Tax=Parathielavia hyrcaniae TaxID=113614 RepID=A0AAN6SZQ6_9PEZI|nr:Pkinase-domain-containing protein [Parathielavia hyrcaniae]